MMSMRTAAAIASGVMLLATGALAQTAEDVFGTWRHPENGSYVQMYKCGDGLCAKIVSVKDGQKTDDKNPDAAKRNRPIVGLVIMSGAKKSGAASWQGQLYDRSSGKTYSGTVTVKSKSQLDLTGCVAAVLCKTVAWSRVGG